MSSETVTIKTLDGTAVLCQNDGCDKPALYLFYSAERTSPCFAHCETHARQVADQVRLALPPAKETGSGRWIRASA